MIRELMSRHFNRLESFFALILALILFLFAISIEIIFSLNFRIYVPMLNDLGPGTKNLEKLSIKFSFFGQTLSQGSRVTRFTLSTAGFSPATPHLSSFNRGQKLDELDHGYSLPVFSWRFSRGKPSQKQVLTEWLCESV